MDAVNLADVIAVGVGKEDTVAPGLTLGDAGNEQGFLLLFPVRPGQLTAKVDKDASAATGDLGHTAADLVGPAIDPNLHG